jgi:hypothetical protein
VPALPSHILTDKDYPAFLEKTQKASLSVDEIQTLFPRWKTCKNWREFRRLRPSDKTNSLVDSATWLKFDLLSISTLSDLAAYEALISAYPDVQQQQFSAWEVFAKACGNQVKEDEKWAKFKEWLLFLKMPQNDNPTWSAFEARQERKEFLAKGGNSLEPARQDAYFQQWKTFQQWCTFLELTVGKRPLDSWEAFISWLGTKDSPCTVHDACYYQRILFAAWQAFQRTEKPTENWNERTPRAQWERFIAQYRLDQDNELPESKQVEHSEEPSESASQRIFSAWKSMEAWKIFRQASGVKTSDDVWEALKDRCLSDQATLQRFEDWQEFLRFARPAFERKNRVFSFKPERQWETFLQWEEFTQTTTLTVFLQTWEAFEKWQAAEKIKKAEAAGLLKGSRPSSAANSRAEQMQEGDKVHIDSTVVAGADQTKPPAPAVVASPTAAPAAGFFGLGSSVLRWRNQAGTGSPVRSMSTAGAPKSPVAAAQPSAHAPVVAAVVADPPPVSEVRKDF